MKVIATAGHVDHGKSTLIQALTGIDPDRLQEEKQRGMTIDLGFAWLTLPDGEPVGIVDVPGHIDFIKNMVAGIGAVDAALLVVAADEGVMPQTHEHLAVLDLLNIPRGVVALTKIDMVDEEGWLELVQEEVREELAGTTLADHGRDNRSFQSRHHREVECDGFTLSALFGTDTGISARGIDKGQNRHFETFSHFHQAQSLAITFRTRHPEVALDLVPHFTTLLVTDNHDRRVVQAGRAANDRQVIGVASVTM
jgi:small GTP-binding protein